MNKINLARNIKKARTSSSISQKELADKLGVSDRTISAYETGRALPPATSIAKIAKLTNTNISELMGSSVSDHEGLKMMLKDIDTKISQSKKSDKIDSRTKIDVFVGVVLLNSKKQIYLIKEEDKHRISLGRWNLPGGSVDGDESLIDSAKRETKEETGYDSEVKSLLGCYLCKKGKASWIYVVFKSEMLSNGKEKIDPGVKDGKWFSNKEFLNLRGSKIVHPDMKLVYKIALKQKGLAVDSIKYIDYDKE